MYGSHCNFKDVKWQIIICKVSFYQENLVIEKTGFQHLFSGISQKQSSKKEWEGQHQLASHAMQPRAWLFPSIKYSITGQLNLQEEWVGRCTNPLFPRSCKCFDKEYDVQEGISDGGFFCLFYKQFRIITEKTPFGQYEE